MAKKTNEQAEQKKTRKQLLRLNNTFRNAMSNISVSANGTTLSAANELERMDRDINILINKELSNTKSITSADMSTFLVKLFNDMDNGLQEKKLNDIFENDTAGLFQFFQQRYQNRNLLYEDLEMICSQLFELDEAILTTRDAIVTSDDISNTISRTLRFNDTSKTDSDDTTMFIKTIEDVERKLKLLPKLKNLVIPNALKFGTYYVYVCPYSKLFQDQYEQKMKNPANYGGVQVQESITESFVKDVKDEFAAHKLTIRTNNKELESTLKDYVKNISIENEAVSIPLLEGIDISELVVTDDKFAAKRKEGMKKAGINKGTVSPDGVYDQKEVKDGLFSDETGCYIKYIDPRKIIPIKILDKVIGYYYIHDSQMQINKSPFSTTIKITSAASGVPNQNSEDVESMFLSKITDAIVKAFDKPFLEKNQQFKELILNALIYNDLYRKNIQFQFIPAEYMVEFKVNEDPDGDGQSVLQKALFYAKLYLALLIFKMVSIITRSNDQRIYYIKNSGIDQNMTNKVQEVARSLKGRQINFMDLLNYNSIISKIGAYKEIFIPIGRSGERGIDFDTLAGQDVPLNTELMEMLRTNMINGTGVPSVIMNYINEADYAKTLVMANSKFVGRVISLQIDLNGPTTDFYKLVLRHSNTSIDPDKLDSFEFVYNPPKTLNNTNLGDMVANADQVIALAIKSVTGENSDQTNDNNKIKDYMYNTLIRQYLPMINWSAVDDAYTDAKLLVAEDNIKNNDKSDENI